LKLALYVALVWAVWHLPDHFAEEGWGVDGLMAAPIVFASLFFARALFVWFYNVTAFRVPLLVAISIQASTLQSTGCSTGYRRPTRRDS
jgi:hypothetical protein